VVGRREERALSGTHHDRAAHGGLAVVGYPGARREFRVRRLERSVVAEDKCGSVRSMRRELKNLLSRVADTTRCRLLNGTKPMVTNSTLASEAADGTCASRPAIPAVDEIFYESPAVAGWSSPPVWLEAALERLPEAACGVELDLVEQLALTIVGLMEEVRGVRTTLSISLGWSHALHTENLRLKKRLAETLEEWRRVRRSAA
jgi:hypothetical protein